MLQDEVLYKIADRVKNFAVIYLCDIDEVSCSFKFLARTPVN